MADDSARVEQMLAECGGYDFVRFTFSDIHGIPKGKSVPKRHFQKYLKTGPLLWEGAVMLGPRSEIPAKLPCGFGNIAITPQPGTFHHLPWVTDGKYKVGEFLCEPCWLYQPGKPGASTRTIARKQLEALDDLGYKVFSGFEAEYMLLDESDKSPLRDRQDFATCSGLAMQEDFLYQMDDYLLESNINIELHQTEYSPAQIESVLQPRYGIASPDQVFEFKQAVREIAKKRSILATFMTMPFPGVGNGLHFNHSIWNNTTGENAFYNENKDDKLSNFAKHWLAGLLKHVPALSLICGPTVNCFRRYHNAWAPDSINWAIDDRYATIRVKNDGPQGTYIENRLPGGSANPYLVLAANIAAGLDGVINKLECPPATPADQVKEKVPYTFQEGFKALKEDKVMVAALGEEFIEWFSAEKEQIELVPLKDVDISKNDAADFAKERELYLETM